jgi:hypothetical protein
MPDTLLLNKMCFSSALNEAPPIEVVAMNCSIVYRFGAVPFGAAAGAANAGADSPETTNVARPQRRIFANMKSPQSIGGTWLELFGLCHQSGMLVLNIVRAGVQAKMKIWHDCIALRRKICFVRDTFRFASSKPNTFSFRCRPPVALFCAPAPKPWPPSAAMV